ncbi:polymeric immunoglobulin receptor-like [Megalops cyprinoides]|uniref:polymeric immunoglobulin receptor-like n=1 Tax=Megalops cyprinoides TaxID=118141 RepID=UPI001863A3C3|nr:polymeric immunoglobulin receptor-like [Megalops cyprinoides]
MTKQYRADSVSTVSRVTVQRGRSVTIPCHYDLKYENSVKYWCLGYSWPSCSVVVSTDSPKNNGKVSITDDPAHQVFTVSMKSLQEGDSEYYWCAIEIGGTETLDDFACLHLTVTAGTPGLWVDQQEVTGVEGGSVRVQCRYSNRGDTKKWCRSWGSCVAGNSGNVRISDDRLNNVFTVTVRRLERKDTGWYWCAAGDLQIPVHITVTQPATAVTTSTSGLWMDYQEVTGVEGGSVSVQCRYSNRGDTKKWCRSRGSCVTGNSGKVRISDDFTVTVSGLKMQDTGWYWCAAGDLQIPVHITVTQPATAVTTTDNGHGSQHISTSSQNAQLTSYRRTQFRREEKENALIGEGLFSHSVLLPPAGQTRNIKWCKD